jgi:hypothetical protein
MTYSPPVSSPRPPAFTNVFVNPASYRHFMQTGTWPDKTIFILEIRSSESEGSINRGGNYQAGVVAIEAEVKDASLPGGWAYFDFRRDDTPVKALPQTETCYACHKANGAVERTFVQFYPTLMEVAQAKGTINSGWNPHSEGGPQQ